MAMLDSRLNWGGSTKAWIGPSWFTANPFGVVRKLDGQLLGLKGLAGLAELADLALMNRSLGDAGSTMTSDQILTACQAAYVKAGFAANCQSANTPFLGVTRSCSINGGPMVHACDQFATRDLDSVDIATVQAEVAREQQPGASAVTSQGVWVSGGTTQATDQTPSQTKGALTSYQTSASGMIVPPQTTQPGNTQVGSSQNNATAGQTSSGFSLFGLDPTTSWLVIGSAALALYMMSQNKGGA